MALRGEAGDGHDHVADALARGAAGAMVHRGVSGAERLLQVDDTLAALHRLGGHARARFGGRLVAVTGSVGKTTTKEMLRTILLADHSTRLFPRTHSLPASSTLCSQILPMARVGRATWSEWAAKTESKIRDL